MKQTQQRMLYLWSYEKEEPDVRIFTCEKCETTMYRDLNSAVNMAKKERKLLPGLGYVGVEHPTYVVWWDWKRQKIVRNFASTCGVMCPPF